MAQLISVSSTPNQVLSTPVNVNGGYVTLQLSIYFNRITNFWVMDIADQTGVPLVNSVPLLTGTWPAANILMPYQYLNIGSAFVINVSSGGSVDYPDSTNLGTDFLLLWDNNSAYVSGEPFGGNMIVVGPAGPPGPAGLPGAVGGIYVMGSSGTLVPSPGDTQFTQYTKPTGSITIAAPSPVVPGAVFLVQIVQDATGGRNVTWDTYYKGISGFALDTTANTQAVLMFQISTDGTSAQLINVAQNGWSVL